MTHQDTLNALVPQSAHASNLRGMGWRFKVSPSGYTSRNRTTKTIHVSRKALTGCPDAFKAALNSVYQH